jgi:bis(5'-nucleosyl)-tetraphosphatase (symmetrical)
MSTWVVGDVHGCRKTLDRLLDVIDFDAERDELWTTGDLVNGGPDSLAVLRWARNLGDALTVVLGNHDLHMLAVASGARPMRESDDFGDVLEAPDADDLLDWLRHRPLLHRRGETVLVHAGLLPSWDLDRAEQLAGEVESVLRSGEAGTFFESMYGNEPRAWDDALEGEDRWRIVVNTTTRMRTLDEAGRLDFDFKETLEDVPDDRVPWFEHPDRVTEGARLLFGHWSAIGYHRRGRVHALDSGCVWGGELTAMRLEDGEIVQVPSEMPEQF